MENSSVYMIVPVFNEEFTIRKVVVSLLEYGFSVIVVDDASTDNSYSCVKDLDIHYLLHEVNLGQGAAIQTGIEYALTRDNAKIFATFDGDGQHRAEDVMEMIVPIEKNETDIVMGSRFLSGAFSNASLTRKAAIQTARGINFLFTGLWLTDAHNGLRVFNRKTASVLDLKENGMAHASEILFRVAKYKLRFKEMPVHILYTDYSRKKGQSIFSGVKIFFDLVFNRIFD
jgi:glycosyltransferase involved in cell wall biosynthesis